MRCWSNPKFGGRWWNGLARDVVHSIDGSIDRRALGSIVFADASALRDLEAILHPVMRRRFEEIIARQTREGTAPLVVLDAAILLEAGWDSLCDLIVFVDASLPVRLDRVARSRGWTAQVLRAREAAQWSCEQKRARAHVRFRNEATLEDLDRNVDGLFGILTGRSSAEQLGPGDRRPVCGQVLRAPSPCHRELPMTFFPAHSGSTCQSPNVFCPTSRPWHRFLD